MIVMCFSICLFYQGGQCVAASSSGEDVKMNRVSLVRQDGLCSLHHLTAVQNRTLEIILCSLSGHVQPSKGKKTRDCEEVKPSDSCSLNMLSMWVAVFPVDAENMIALTSTELPG